MSVIELLLRLGVSLVAWMILYTHLIWTATLRVTTCGADGDDLWRLILGFAPFTLGFCLLLGASKKLSEVHKILNWLGTPMLLLIPWAAWSMWPTFQQATLQAQGICVAQGGNPAAWHIWWGPVQCVVLLSIAFAVWRNRQPESSNANLT